MMNRAQILSSYCPTLQLDGFSNCDDVQELKKALDDFKAGKNQFDLGHGGTSLRFFALRVSRTPGKYRITASSRLLERPIDELFYILEQLGVTIFREKDAFVLESNGWQSPEVPIEMDVTRSSQFLSSLILNSWDLPFDLEFVLKGKLVSEPYFLMTLEMCKSFGLNILKNDLSWIVPKGQKFNTSHRAEIEVDMSSAFSVSALAVLYGQIQISPFPLTSLQSDFAFIEVLKNMGAEIRQTAGSLTIHQAKHLMPIEINLHNAPDLFPVLAVLCAFANGKSVLHGASQLAFKESNRIQKISELLNLYGIKNFPQADGIVVHGQGHLIVDSKFLGEKSFSTDNDHRLAMAASLFKFQDDNLNILNPEVVSKSFPEFWNIFNEGINSKIISDSEKS